MLIDVFVALVYKVKRNNFCIEKNIFDTYKVDRRSFNILLLYL